jgi:superfamily II DNA helicase RecQ
MKNLQTLLQDIDQLLDSSVEPPKPTQDSERIQESPEPIEEISTDVETDTLLATLRENFGHADFRENQREIAQAILDGENLLAAFPTGYGKSLCYQLPALMLPGITVVVSPGVMLLMTGARWV